MSEVNGLVDQIRELAKKNGLATHLTISKQKSLRDEIKKSCSIDHMTSLTILITKSEKDFDYLLHPSRLPTAYEACCKEIIRRKKFY